MIGLVLAAGKGERLRPLTDALPKTLLAVDGERTILDVVLANFAAVGLERAVVVSGFAAGRVDDLLPELERRHGLALETVFNPKAEEWNNAYSLWCAREFLAEGVLLSNGDTVHPPSVEEDVLAARGAGVTLAVDRHKPLGAEEMKVHLSPEGRLERINKALDPASAHGEYIGITLIEPAAAEPLADALEATWRRDPGLYYEDGFQELADRGGDVGAAAIRAVEWVEVDDHTDLCAGARNMPLLTRMIGAPLAVEIGAGAVNRLAPLLADRRISSGGHVAVVVGPGLGAELAEVLRPQLSNAVFIQVDEGSVAAALDLGRELRAGFYDALVGIGGGRTLDVAKHAASLNALPMVSVATSLAHDGLASPVASLFEGGRKGSYGVQMPIAVVVDLDYVRRAEPDLRRGGIGDVLSNLSAVADWRLAEHDRGEAVDGLATTFAQTAAQSVLHRDDGIDDDPFLAALAEALVLSGLAMATAGSSRPCSGGEHEIVHAIDHAFPGTANHGCLVGVAMLFTTSLRGEHALLRELDAALRRHGLPRTPADLGLDDGQFVQAVVHAPETRPDRYTVLERLHLDAAGARRALLEHLDALGER